MKLKISNRNLVIASILVILATGAYHFGITGVRTLAAIFLFFLLPFFLILRNLKIQNDERLFFALFIGIGLFSTTVFYIGRVIPSFRVSIVLAFIVLLIIPFILAKIKKK